MKTHILNLPVGDARALLLARPRACRGITLLEVIVVIGLLALTAGLLLPALSGTKHRHNPYAGCLNNLKQISLGFRLWSNDHDDQFPWMVSTNDGGTKEIVPTGSPLPHILAASNDILSTRILFCRSDYTRVQTNSFPDLTSSNLSYFVSVDATESKPRSILTGDRNLEGPRTNNFLLYGPGQPARIGPGLHKDAVNLAFSDGSVQTFSAKALAQFTATNLLTQRLALP
jgi:hypothetical protein